MPEGPPPLPLSGQPLPPDEFKGLEIGKTYRPQGSVQLPGIARRVIDSTSTITVKSFPYPNTVTVLVDGTVKMNTWLTAEQVATLDLKPTGGRRRKTRGRQPRKTKRRQTRRRR